MSFRRPARADLEKAAAHRTARALAAGYTCPTCGGALYCTIHAPEPDISWWQCQRNEKHRWQQRIICEWVPYVAASKSNVVEEVQ